MVGRDQARIDLETAAPDREIMEAADEVDAAHFLNFEPAARGAEIERQALERDDAVTEAVQVRVALTALLAGEVVDDDDGDVERREELLQRQHLATVTQRVLGEQAHLRQAVEHDPFRPRLLDDAFDQFDRAAELAFPGVKNRLLPVRPQSLFRRGELEDGHAFERPAVRRRDAA